MLGHRLEQIFNMAIKSANYHRHEYLTLESLLYALLHDPIVVHTITSIGGNHETLKKKLEVYLEQSGNFPTLTNDEINQLFEEQFKDEKLRQLAKERGVLYQPELSESVQRVIQRAALHVQSSGKEHIQGINILVAMFSEKESYALLLLEEQNLRRLDVVDYLAHGPDRSKNSSTNAPAFRPEQKNSKPKNSIEEFALNLNKEAIAGRLDPLIGREVELERIIQILSRRRKNNPLLVGDAGVGKTAISYGLAEKIVKGEVPSSLKNTTLYLLDIASLIAGTRFRGDFEERFKQLLKNLQSDPETSQNNILVIDEIHNIVGAGSTSGGHLDASGLLRPYLANGEIKCLGMTTFEEFRKFIDKDASLTRRFQQVEIKGPNYSDTFKILKGIKEKLEDFHHVIYPDSLLKIVIELSEQYLTDKQLPDKAIDILDEAGAYIRTKLKNKTNDEKIKVHRGIVEQIISDMAKVPIKTVSITERDKIKHLKANLQKSIFGQDHAVERLTDCIYLSRSGLRSEEGPMASFLFSGPTGVGKTELARQLATLLGIHFERFDMSEFMEKHSVSKLIGAPPGYVGHESGGKLTESINKNPHCVLLLDEIEKAHQDIYNILLQVMDHGKLTDSSGRTTNFKNTILILTTNIGAKELESGQIGLQNEELTAQAPANHTRSNKVLKNHFSPEFRNRLDGILQFNKLAPKMIEQIVLKFLSELSDQLKKKKIMIEFSDDIVSWIAKKAYDPKLGARPIRRFINENLKKPLAEKILFEKMSKNTKIKVNRLDETPIFNFEA